LPNGQTNTKSLKMKFKEFAKILLGFSRKEIELAIKNGVLIEVTL
jgi:hypothetical protein